MVCLSQCYFWMPLPSVQPTHSGKQRSTNYITTVVKSENLTCFFRGSLANKRQAFLNLKSVKAGGDGVGERVGLDDGRGGDDSTVSSQSVSSGEDAAGGGGSGGDEAEESKLKTTLTLSRSTNRPP